MKGYVSLLALIFASLSVSAQIKAIKLEFDDVSMNIELSQLPKIVMEYGYLVIKTSNESIALSLPCEATFVEATGSALEDVVVRNNDEAKPFNVYTIDGKRVATLKDESDFITLRKGIYIINKKKMIIK